MQTSHSPGLEDADAGRQSMIWKLVQEAPPDFKNEAWFCKTLPKFDNLEGELLPALDFILIAVNEQELMAAVHRFCVMPLKPGPSVPHYKKVTLSKTNLTVFLGRCGPSTKPVQVGILHQPEIGAAGQWRAVSSAVKILNPHAVISVGVGWGNPGRLLRDPKPAFYGDVMVSEMLVDFSDNAKMGSDGFFVPRNESPSAAKALVALFSSAGLPGQWMFSRPDQRPDQTECQVLLGKLATGGILLDNADFVRCLTESTGYDDIIGGEMEAWGLYNAVTEVAEEGFHIQWVVVKGICDWGMGKSKGWQPFSAAAAADLVYVALSSCNKNTTALDDKVDASSLRNDTRVTPSPQQEANGAADSKGRIFINANKSSRPTDVREAVLTVITTSGVWPIRSIDLVATCMDSGKELTRRSISRMGSNMAGLEDVQRTIASQGYFFSKTTLRIAELELNTDKPVAETIGDGVRRFLHLT